MQEMLKTPQYPVDVYSEKEQSDYFKEQITRRASELYDKKLSELKKERSLLEH